VRCTQESIFFAIAKSVAPISQPVTSLINDLVREMISNSMNMVCQLFRVFMGFTLGASLGTVKDKRSKCNEIDIQKQEKLGVHELCKALCNVGSVLECRLGRMCIPAVPRHCMKPVHPVSHERLTKDNELTFDNSFFFSWVTDSK
jgi:hypothetical protein